MRRPAFLALSLLALGALVPLSCTHDFDIFQGGGGGIIGCTTDLVCDDLQACTKDVCNETTGQCSHEPLPDGLPPAGVIDTPNNCKTPVCKDGALVSEADDGDLPDDANPCTDDGCSGGMPVHDPVAADTPCGAGLFCDGAGKCVGCTTASQCPGTDCTLPACTGGMCASNDAPLGTSCNNGNGVCTGMGTCVPCLADAHCNDPQLICTNQQCVDSCGSGVKDGQESDVDCGGPCSPCADGDACLVDADCTSAVCNASVCQMPTCTDTTKNALETDADCGGPACPKCATSKACAGPSDCLSNACNNGICQPSCTDTIENGGETDVDCGGVVCPKCMDGQGCAADGDCASGYCNASNLCAAPSCIDSDQNGDETDVDCGGSCPMKCANTKKCLVNADCLSVYCHPAQKTCMPFTCGDGLENLGETDVDCGGGACAKCASDKGCNVNADCISNNCKGNGTCM